MSTQTTDELKAMALFMSAEPQDGTSQFDAQSLRYMQAVYDTFVNGGTLGTRDIAISAGLYERIISIPTTDWLWLKAFPPFAFNTTPGIIGSGASATLNLGQQIGTVSVTYGSPTVTFSSAPTPSVAGWRLLVLTQAQGIRNSPFTTPRVLVHDATTTTATLDIPWPQETQTVSNFVLYQAEYPLPADFVRFCEAWSVQGSGQWAGGELPRLQMGNYENITDPYPFNNNNQGPPSAAARLSPSTIMLNRWDTLSYRIEGQYIARPPALVTGVNQIPRIPERYRHALAVGAAMLIMQDKSDDRTSALASEFREILAHMGIEQRKEQFDGSQLNGRHLFRGNHRRRGLLRTSSGLPLW